MLSRLALGLPLVLVLGCGASPSPAATPDQPPTAAAQASTPASPPAVEPTPGTGSATAAASPPSAAKAADTSKTTVSRAVASDAPISTKITQDEILALVNKNADMFYRCYSLGTAKNLRAKVTVKATVGPTGAVNAVEIVDSNTKSPKVDACVADGFKKLVFERPAGSGATVFTFPMSFDGMEQVK
jgi:hypothetical protein